MHKFKENKTRSSKNKSKFDEKAPFARDCALRG